LKCLLMAQNGNQWLWWFSKLVSTAEVESTVFTCVLPWIQASSTLRAFFFEVHA